MSKTPKLEHAYHPKKDRLEITIHHYGLQSKKSRASLIKEITGELERSATPRMEKARKKEAKKKGRKNFGSGRHASDLPLTGD